MLRTFQNNQHPQPLAMTLTLYLARDLAAYTHSFPAYSVCNPSWKIQRHDLRGTYKYYDDQSKFCISVGFNQRHKTPSEFSILQRRFKCFRKRFNRLSAKSRLFLARRDLFDTSFWLAVLCIDGTKEREKILINRVCQINSRRTAGRGRSAKVESDRVTLETGARADTDTRTAESN